MKKIIIATSCCIVLLLLGYCGYRGYKVGKENRLLTMARTFAQQGDDRNELICLQQVLRVNPRNVEANRRMADLCEQQRALSAMIWRERVVNLVPDSVGDRLAQAQTAMVFKDYVAATNALAAVIDSGKKTSIYQNLAGVAATALNDTGSAEKYFVEAVRLDSANLVPQLNLAVLRLHGTNPAYVEIAKADLQRISLVSTNAGLRGQAKRELLTEALRSKKIDVALPLATDLALTPDANFGDKLLRLDLLRETKSPDYAPVLAVYQRDAATNGANLSEMATWLMARSKPETTLKWLQTLPAQTLTNQPGALLMAECLALAQNWGGLQSTLENQNWNELEFLRHGFLARALRAQNLTGASAAEWALAQKLASDNKIMLVQTYRLAAGWNWIDEADQILWTIVNRYPEEKWAGQVLVQSLVQSGRTRSLLQFYSLQNKRNPDDVSVQNDLAMIAMLLEASELKPFDIIKEAYAKAPQNPAVISTYAYALYLQNQFPDALKVIQKLPAEVLNSPGVAGYYALILQANGNREGVKKLFELTLAKSTLLPEEKRIFESALKN